MEVQSHGNEFEDRVIKAITGISKDEYQALLKNAYTSSMDIQKGIHSNVNYSIKVSQYGQAIGCADIVRFNQHCKEDPFTIVLGSWYQKDKEHKVFYEVTEFDITPEIYSELWGTVDSNTLTEFVDYIKSIPKGREAQEANQVIWPQKRKVIIETHEIKLVSIDAKVDSKTQRRTQCGMKSFELKGSGKITYRIFSQDYKGIKLPYEIESSARTFKKS